MSGSDPRGNLILACLVVLLLCTSTVLSTTGRLLFQTTVRVASAAANPDASDGVSATTTFQDTPSSSFLVVFGGRVKAFPSMLQYNGANDSIVTPIGSPLSSGFYPPVACALQRLTKVSKTASPTAVVEIRKNGVTTFRTHAGWCADSPAFANELNVSFDVGDRCDVIVTQAATDETTVTLLFSVAQAGTP